MKKIKINSLLASMLALMLVLSACGNGGNQGAQAQGGTAQGGAAQGGTAQERQTITLRVGSGNPETAPWIQAFERFFLEVVEERVYNETNYEINWVRSFGGTVIPLGGELEGVQAGLVDVGSIVMMLEFSRMPLQAMTFMMPFAIPTADLGAIAYAQMKEEFPEFETSFERFNQYYMAIGFSDQYGVFSNFPINSLDDVAGRRIGAASVNISWIEGSGAAGVLTTLPEAYPNIQLGVVDAVILPSRSTIDLQVYEVAPYYLDAGLGMLPLNAITVNMDSWYGLPAEVQQIMREVGDAYLMNSVEFIMGVHEGSLQILRDAGATISELSLEEQIAWAASLNNIVRDDLVPLLDAAGYPGEVLVTRWLELMEAQGVPRVRDWLNE
ncbi:MAG: C4-dicarboxylate TRAP transporter substrate-binding protein [Defluviitaleaceae bacterium]|nr:C4-dicarboxylate TRAP transporter substrate-binding protein [Defluviitaleaceae bacterium]